MKTMIDTLKTSVLAFANDEEGTAVMEYGLLAALVSVASTVAMIAVATSIDGVLTYVSDALDASITPP